MWLCNMPPRHRLKNPFTMSKNGGKSAIRYLSITENFVFISGKIQKMVELNGFEPLTPCLQSRCSTN